MIFNVIFINQSLSDFANNSTNNGILTFILGSLFAISIYHILLYFQHRDKAYLYYSIYTFLIFLAYITKVENGFLKTIVESLEISNSNVNFFRWTYNCVYFAFAVTFLNLWNINKTWFKYIIYPIVVLYGLAVIAKLLKIIGFNELYNLFNQFYLPLITLQTLFSFWFIFKLKGYLKYYIIIGAFILFITSIIGEKSIRDILGITREVGDFYFYIGVFIENICFSLGLGHKQWQIIEERNNANKKLKTKLNENEALKDTINKQFEEQINSLSKQIKFRQEISDLKLKALRSQMNPHFIFNSLNSIKLYIINNEKENAVYYLNKFAKLVRKILDASLVKETSLKEELETSELYMNIENIRFSDEIKFTITVDEKVNTSTINVPSLILQPFIENAIWHGLSSKVGKKTIDIAVNFIDENYIKISIKDNGIGRDASEKIKKQKVIKRQSVGINITKDRLSDFSKSYVGDFKIEIKDIKDSNKQAVGTQVILDIPTNKY